MIISPANTETEILTNIRRTLEQLKDGTKANSALVIPSTGANASVTFYIDDARTETLFTDSVASHPSHFNVNGTNTFYSVQDADINLAPTISDIYSQPFYWVTATFTAQSLKLVYRNVDNLMFQKVTISTKKNPPFSTSGNEAVVVPGQQKLETIRASGDTSYVILNYEVYVQLAIYDWAKLSEENREAARVNATNSLRLALYADRFRGGNAVQKDTNLQGTNVDEVRLLPSDGVMKGVCKVRVAYMVTSTAY